jgi:hypothetical protein
VPSDDFNRADGGLGANWTALVGTWAVVSNQAECNDDNGGSGYYARYDGSGADAGSSDMYAEVVTNSTQTNGSSNTGPGVRHRSGATTGYQFPTNLNDSCSFWRINAGSETQIATFTTAVAVGDTVRLEAVGRTFRFKVNGALRNLLQDTNITDGQRGAMNGYNNVGSDVVRVDSFATGPMTDLTAPHLADWSAQTARTTGTPSTPTIPAQVTAGDLVVVPATVRATTSNITAPAGEGWEQVQLASGNSLRMYAFAKIWGLGDTDDTTPSFAKDAGTVGFFTHALIFRNPAHATAPWTSVASAIVASDQQSNAASATVTAPSVTHDGAHCTIVRLFSSADDNALNAPSEGVLVTGGAAYDATDIAQACSVIEDVTVTTSTGTATVTESVNGNDANNGITLVLAIPSAGATVDPDDAGQAHTVDAAALTQAHSLVEADADQGQSVDSAALTQAHVLAVADAAQAQTVDSAALTVNIALTPGDASQAQTVDNGAFIQAHTLAPAEATQSQTVDAAAVVQAHALSAADTAQAQSADAGSLVQVHALTAADAAQAHSVDNADVVVGGIALTPADAVQAQAVDGAALTQVHVLVAAGADQAQSADSATLTQAHALVAAGADQAQTADSTDVLVGGIGLDPADAFHGHTADAAVLTQVHVLAAGDAGQAQLVDQPLLTQAHLLVAAEATQAQTVDAGVLVGDLPDPNPTIVRIRDNRTGTLTDRPIQRLREPA